MKVRQLNGKCTRVQDINNGKIFDTDAVKIAAFGSHDKEDDRAIAKCTEFELFPRLLAVGNCYLEVREADGNCLYRELALAIFGNAANSSISKEKELPIILLIRHWNSHSKNVINITYRFPVFSNLSDKYNSTMKDGNMKDWHLSIYGGCLSYQSSSLKITKLLV